MSEGRDPAETPSTAGEDADPQRIARIVAGYRERHPVSGERLTPLVREVQEALRELGATGAEPPSAPAAAPRRGGEGGDRSMRFWQRLVMMALGLLLVWLLCSRLAWIG